MSTKKTTPRIPSQDTVVHAVQTRLAQLRPAEVRVAQVLLAHPDQFFQWSVTEVAERAKVSEATVIRFAKLLGFSGFQALKITLAQEQATIDHGVLEVDPGDDWASALLKMHTYYQQATEATLGVAKQPRFRAVLDLLRHSTRTVTLGVGTSGLAAQVLSYKLGRAGFRVSHDMDGHFQSLAAASCRPGDVAVAFSVSGSTRDTTDALTLAKEAGAATVAVTHFVRSPLARLADHVLLSQGFDSPVVSGSVLAHVSQLILIDALYLGIALENFDEVRARMEQSAEQIARFKKY